jgi:hypothetical protein
LAIYVGDATEFETFEDFGIEPDYTIGKWKLWSGSSECGIDVICRKALFFKPLGFEKDEAISEFKKAKKALRKVINEQKSRVKQLSLWEVKHG